MHLTSNIFQHKSCTWRGVVESPFHPAHRAGSILVNNKNSKPKIEYQLQISNTQHHNRRTGDYTNWVFSKSIKKGREQIRDTPF